MNPVLDLRASSHWLNDPRHSKGGRKRRTGIWRGDGRSRYRSSISAVGGSKVGPPLRRPPDRAGIPEPFPVVQHRSGCQQPKMHSRARTNPFSTGSAAKSWNCRSMTSVTFWRSLESSLAGRVTTATMASGLAADGWISNSLGRLFIQRQLPYRGCRNAACESGK